MNRQRLDAESVRDAVLRGERKLDLTMGGPSAEQFWFKDDHSPVSDYSRFDIDSAASYRRSVYRFIVRSAPDPFMDRLDCPDASLITAKRNTTITAIQALALLNNPFMVRQSEHLAARARGWRSSRTAADRVDLPADAGGAIPAPTRRAPGGICGAEWSGKHGSGDFEQQRVSVCGLRSAWTGGSFFGIPEVVWAASRWPR
jgi:hypothetical protein